MIVDICQNRHEVPVTHRARGGGKTNHGLQVFLWRPVLDLVGVWWFSKQRFREFFPTSAPPQKD